MSEPILLSDEEEESALSTPFPAYSKKRRTETDLNPNPNSNPNPTVFLIDDDPTPQKKAINFTSSFVPETPMSGFSNSDVAIVKCTNRELDPEIRASNFSKKFSGISGLICLESDNESEGDFGREKFKESDIVHTDGDSMKDLESNSELSESACFLGNTDVAPTFDDTSVYPTRSLDIHQLHDSPAKDVGMGQKDNITTSKRSKVKAGKKNNKIIKNKMTKEEGIRVMEEKKQKKEQEKLQKAAMKAEAAEFRNLQKEKQKWEKGKFALKSIVAEIDTKVVELGSVGGHLLTRFAEKGLTFRITSNAIERSIIWKMNVPESISQLSSETVEIQYILLVFEADGFCNLVNNDSLLDHVSNVRSHYPSYTICYLTNRLMSFINKREQQKYKNPTSNSSWRRPCVEEALAKLTTHFVKVHSRQCLDEAELAEHIVGLTSSLASCQFRKKLTPLNVSANGSIVSKDAVERDVIKKSVWLKALVAIPKVQPRFAIAISKKYPTMKSLLSVYMDPNKSVHEKEFLLKDLAVEGLLGEVRRLGEICSKRVYRILMSQNGCIKTDDIEAGADFFGA